MTLFLFCCLLIGVSLVLGETINREVSWIIDASTSIVRLSAEIKVSQASKDYSLAFLNHWADHLSFLSVTSGGKPLVIQPPVM